MSQEKKDTPKERQRKEDILKGFEKLASELGGLNKEVKHGKTIPDSGIKVLDGIKKELEESLHSDYVVDVAQVHNFCTVVEKIKSSQKIYEDVLKEEGITPARKRSIRGTILLPFRMASFPANSGQPVPDRCWSRP